MAATDRSLGPCQPCRLRANSRSALRAHPRSPGREGERNRATPHPPATRPAGAGVPRPVGGGAHQWLAPRAEGERSAVRAAVGAAWAATPTERAAAAVAGAARAAPPTEGAAASPQVAWMAKGRRAVVATPQASAAMATSVALGGAPTAPTLAMTNLAAAVAVAQRQRRLAAAAAAPRRSPVEVVAESAGSTSAVAAAVANMPVARREVLAAAPTSSERDCRRC